MIAPPRVQWAAPLLRAPLLARSVHSSLAQRDASDPPPSPRAPLRLTNAPPIKRPKRQWIAGPAPPDRADDASSPSSASVPRAVAVVARLYRRWDALPFWKRLSLWLLSLSLLSTVAFFADLALLGRRLRAAPDQAARDAVWAALHARCWGRGRLGLMPADDYTRKLLKENQRELEAMFLRTKTEGQVHSGEDEQMENPKH